MRFPMFPRRRLVALVTSWLLAALFGALTTVAVYASVNESSAQANVTSFEPAEGWNTVLTTVDPDSPVLPITWAANVPFAQEESATGFPANTIRELPPEGTVITVIGPRKYTGEETFPKAEFPLTVSQGFCSFDEYEGQLAPQVSMCLVDTMVGDDVLNVTVWFRTNKPSDAPYGEADAELARLVVATQEGSS